ncbi:Putative signal recognition particle, SRP19 subunit [Septoria linicola]|uniref:Signal recognition particle, SRP19 subunit n=1 Tax=Septoria linicola TaxID=215465 RepID=A0A9Q9EHL6_9PEZI|nr:putative signal recognition particle, SRP19 subunit [Septoria linicola]USW49428.1 Putative signal recognition particle, SRP19 subunit [Septoria linicola]
MSNPRIEEVDDDEIAEDPEEMDLDAFDFARPQGKSLGGNAAELSDEESEVPPQALEALLAGQSTSTAGGAPPQMPRMSEKDRERMLREQQDRVRSYQCIYPVYFDASRSRDNGRRVSKADAVSNPLAREIVEALAHIGNTLGVALQIALDPMKTHPKDWANPGRVKVEIKKDGKPVSAKINNKHHLYKLIADYLKSHPADEKTPLKMQVPGLPMPKDGKPIPPAIPRGSKISKILPLHSPALSGGGVSENMMADMMQQMGGQLPAGMSDLMGGGSEAGSSGTTQQKPKKVKVIQKR